MKTYREYSLVFESFKAGILSEAEAILQLQIGSEDQIDFLRSIQDKPKLLSLPLWHFDKDPKDMPGTDPLASRLAVPHKLVVDPNHNPNDDETQRVWGLIYYLQNDTILVPTNKGNKRRKQGVQTRRYMVCQRAPHIHNAGQWGLPGGHIEIGEDRKAGMLREVHEEVGLVLENMTRVTTVKHDGVDHHFFAKALSMSQCEGAVMGPEVSAIEYWTEADIRDLVATDKKLKDKSKRRCHKSLRRLVDAWEAFEEMKK